MPSFRFSDYNCIGFDLDNTVLRYNVANMVEMEYNVMAKYLVEEKKYDADCLYQPLHIDVDFLQKGLVLDFDRGNILRISEDGIIRRATHGTKLLSTAEIEEIYPQRRWEALDAFTKNPLDTWNGPWSAKFRCLLDYFDMPFSLLFGRIVDHLDSISKATPEYKIWQDILDAACYMFERTHFKMNVGDYFTSLKKQPEKYIEKCSQDVVSWLRKAKSKKVTFLITGSGADFADFTATYAMGEDWRSLFDIVICYAKKPGFFTEDRPFFSLSGFDENETISEKQFQRGGIYSQGNWTELKAFFKRICNTDSPKCVYIGDNIIQDIYAPSISIGWDTVVVNEEMQAEEMVQHPDKETVLSKIWGSYFSIEDSGKIHRSFSCHIIENYAKICVPSIEFLAHNSIDHEYEAFDRESKKRNGYHPSKSVNLVSL